MSRIDQSAYITAPTGWNRDLIVEYAEHVLRDRGKVPTDSDVAIRLTDSEIGSDHTTTWRVNYTVARGNAAAARPQFRPLSLG
ncbi:hypothetical protein HWD35_20990 [Tsukamurella tyrosinosolvens]|uniref:hypothetical protein n=1 Tax=Tsukamurella tyrosinosolvens TaxID=57704 RepID=UPI001CE1E7CC|nr:hypothetical protein [Tsukamurella tyrosinosolvens]MCA4997203.1 hypothetical protein [Tsukamurella tyrosinosolvens]